MKKLIDFSIERLSLTLREVGMWVEILVSMWLYTWEESICE